MTQKRTDARSRRGIGRDPPTATDANVWLRERAETYAAAAPLERGETVYVFLATGLVVPGIYVGPKPTRHYGLWQAVIIAGKVRHFPVELVVRRPPPRTVVASDPARVRSMFRQ